MSRRKFDVFSPKKIASNSDLEVKEFRLSVKMLFGGLVKTAFNLSWKNFFFRKIVLFKSSSLFNETFFGFLFKNFRQVCQNCVFRVPRNTLRIFLQKKNPISSGHYQHYGEIFLASLTKLNSKCARKLFEGFWFCEKKLFLMFSGHRAKPRRRLAEKYFQQDCQNCIFGFRRNTLIEHIPWRS